MIENSSIRYRAPVHAPPKISHDMSSSFCLFGSDFSHNVLCFNSTRLFYAKITRSAIRKITVIATRVDRACISVP